MVLVTVTALTHFCFENPISMSIGTRVTPAGAAAPASPFSAAAAVEEAEPVALGLFYANRFGWRDEIYIKQM